MTGGQVRSIVKVMRERDALKARVAELEKERDEAREEIRQAQVRHIGTVEHAGAHLCRAESAESSLAASRRQVEGLKEALDEIGGLSLRLRHGGCDASDLSGLEEGLSQAVDIAHNALAQLDALPEPFDADKVFAKIKALDAPQPKARGKDDEFDKLLELSDIVLTARDAIIAEAVELLQQFFNGENTSAAYEAWKHAARAFIEKYGAPKPEAAKVTMRRIEAYDPVKDQDISLDDVYHPRQPGEADE